MKPIRSILLTAILTILAFSSVTYMACHKDKCVDIACKNNGACENGHCSCPTGYEGDRCEVMTSDKFIKTFNGHDLCNINDTNVTNQYSVLFTSIPEKPLEFRMSNFLNNMDDSAACTIRSLDSFTFIGSNNGTTFSGYGTLRRDTLRMSYKVQIDTTSFNCKYIGGSLW
ncbi:MAG: hypothetical protein JWQ38_1778 [Flavipsychrobacter sp.]|nr:hypothetical protein [Flavipsychrobacter sp.]